MTSLIRRFFLRSNREDNLPFSSDLEYVNRAIAIQRAKAIYRVDVHAIVAIVNCSCHHAFCVRSILVKGLSKTVGGTYRGYINDEGINEGADSFGGPIQADR